MAYIAELTSDIRCVKSETNFVADALLRPSVSAIRSDSIINYKELSDQAFAEFTSTLDFQLLKSFNNVLVWCDGTC